ncbi:hypothetical protein MIMGU_mgv1a024696mg, partial [Erythranthe guttata]
QIIINLLQPYVASIKPAQLGLKTTCIEKRGTLGGTCEEYRLVIWPPVRRFFNTLNKKNSSPILSKPSTLKLLARNSQ